MTQKSLAGAVLFSSVWLFTGLLSFVASRFMAPGELFAGLVTIASGGISVCAFTMTIKELHDAIGNYKGYD